jgi:beta-glucosidase
LPFAQDELIRSVCNANRNTIIVVVAGAPVDLHVADSASGSLLWSWFNGSQAGNALADVILGKVNPSGKLPFTIPVKLNDSPAHALGTFPGSDSVRYKEGILVGYRWFDNKNISPRFPFGFGLSYTDFLYSTIAPDKTTYGKKDIIHLGVGVKNTGKHDGMETVQIYVSQVEPEGLQPVRELKAFKKVMIQAGAESNVTMDIPVSKLAWYDEGTGNWIVSPGKYQISAGSSSRDIRKMTEIEIK